LDDRQPGPSPPRPGRKAGEKFDHHLEQCREPGLGGGRLLRNGQIRSAIGSFFTSNPEAVKAVHEKRLEVRLIPQGSMAEAIRAGGAGIGGFYTPTGAGTLLTEGSSVKRSAGWSTFLSRRCGPMWPLSAPGGPIRPATWFTG